MEKLNMQDYLSIKTALNVQLNVALNKYNILCARGDENNIFDGYTIKDAEKEIKACLKDIKFFNENGTKDLSFVEMVVQLKTLVPLGF